jgi:hypothetical protein
MTYSVYSLNFSSLFPQQSEYLMMITLYFLLSIGWTLLSMVWFIICNYIITKADMSKSLHAFCEWLQKVLFCCFPSPPKQDTKTKENKNIIVHNGDSNTVRHQESTEATSNHNMRYFCCQTTFASCFQRHNRVEGSANEQRVAVIEDSGFSGMNPTTATAVGTNQINNDKVKAKCNFCDKCESCQAAVDKEKAKGKNKKSVEDCCNALNYLVFICVVVLMFASNLAMWLIMSQ